MRNIRFSAIANVFLTTGSLLVALLGIEFGFRIYGSVRGIDFRLYPKELKNSDRLPEALFDNGLKPGAEAIATTSDFSVQYSINSRGLRDKEYPYQKPPGITRIAVFGDSFTFGEGVPYGKRFTEIIEENLNNTEVLNFGVPGLGLDLVVTRIFSEGLKYNPDYIVVMLNSYVTHRGRADLADLLNFSATDAADIAGAYTSTSDTIYLQRDDPFFDSRPNIILQNSYAAGYLYYHYLLLSLRQRMASEDRQYWSSYKECVRTPGCDEDLSIDLKDRSIQLLDKLSSVSRDLNIPLIVFNIDDEPLRYFYSGETPFRYIDLHEDLADMGRTQNLSFTYDHHYNPGTHAFIGQKMTGIFRQLLEQEE